MIIKINWDHKRSKHMIERMLLRGISVEGVEEAIARGKKVEQKETDLIEAYLRYFSVVYDEIIISQENIRKIYPVTVKLW